AARVPHGMAGRLVPLVDGQGPGDVGGATVQLVVEPVAPAAYGLGHRDAGSGGVDEVEERDAVPPRPEPRTHRAEGDGAPDPQAALPDVQGPDRVAALTEVGLGRGDDVVQATADDAERHGPGRDVDGLRARVPPVL